MQLCLRIHQKRLGGTVQPPKNLVNVVSPVASVIYDTNSYMGAMSMILERTDGNDDTSLKMIPGISQHDLTLQSIPRSVVLVRIDLGTELLRL